MQKSKKIIQMEKDLAKALAEEAKVLENKDEKYTLFVKKEDEDETQSIQVSEKKLTDIDKAEMVEDVTRIAEGYEYLNKEGFDSVRIGFWMKAIQLIGEPAEHLLKTVFGITEYEIPVFHNLDVFKAVVDKNDWLGDKLKYVLENFETLIKIEQDKNIV